MLARADYGDISIDLYPLDLDSLVLESFSNIPALTYAKDRKLDFAMDRHEPVHINGNYERLQQVMDNLIVNAIKYTQDGGKITVSVYSNDDKGVIEVKDTGIGISKENQERIFERFYQVDDSRSHTCDEDGSGLGLSIVKWIVEAHGGSIEIESQLDVGTTFRVVFPLLKQTMTYESPSSHEQHTPSAFFLHSPQAQ